MEANGYGCTEGEIFPMEASGAILGWERAGGGVYRSTVHSEVYVGVFLLAPVNTNHSSQ